MHTVITARARLYFMKNNYAVSLQAIIIKVGGTRDINNGEGGGVKKLIILTLAFLEKKKSYKI